jgi:hypothetical protein
MTELKPRFGEGDHPAHQSGRWRLLASACWEGYWDGEQVVSRVVGAYAFPLWPARWTTAPAEVAEPRPPWLEPLIRRVLHPDD